MKVVAGIIRNRAGSILIAQRGAKMRFEGLWEFPGGKIKENEDPKNALSRELKEELFLDVFVKEKAYEWTYNYPFALIDFIAYYSEPVTDEIRLLEHMDAKWVELSELKNYNWVPADKELVDYLTEVLK